MQFRKPLQEDLLFALEETIRNVKFSFNTLFARKDFGISYDQWLVLSQIYKKQGVSQQDIAKITVKEAASVSRILSTLQKKDLILRLADDRNKRANKIYLTHQGYDLSARIMKVYNDTYKVQFKGIYEREVNIICDILHRINANQVLS